MISTIFFFSLSFYYYYTFFLFFFFFRYYYSAFVTAPPSDYAFRRWIFTAEPFLPSSSFPRREVVVFDEDDDDDESVHNKIILYLTHYSRFSTSVYVVNPVSLQFTCRVSSSNNRTCRNERCTLLARRDFSADQLVPANTIQFKFHVVWVIITRACIDVIRVIIVYLRIAERSEIWYSISKIPL